MKIRSQFILLFFEVLTMATLHYWGIRARSYASLVVAKAGGVEVTANTNPDMAALKSSGALPFGQVSNHVTSNQIKIDTKD